jgi:hypothetical protein
MREYECVRKEKKKNLRKSKERGVLKNMCILLRSFFGWWAYGSFFELNC